MKTLLCVIGMIPCNLAKHGVKPALIYPFAEADALSHGLKERPLARHLNQIIKTSYCWIIL